MAICIPNSFSLHFKSLKKNQKTIFQSTIQTRFPILKFLRETFEALGLIFTEKDIKNVN